MFFRFDREEHLFFYAKNFTCYPQLQKYLDFSFHVCINIHTNSREIIKLLEKDGWKHVRTTGSHWHFRHDKKSGTVTAPHPKKDLATGTLASILKQAGLK